MIDLCENGGGCDVHANCTMIGPGVKRYSPCYMQIIVYNACLFIQFFKLVKMVLFSYLIGVTARMAIEEMEPLAMATFFR